MGRDLPLYGTTYHITSCDTFTRNFLSKLGVRVNPDTCVPSDPYMEQRNDVSVTSSEQWEGRGERSSI